MNANTYDHLEKLRADIRDEIKKRIEQRDKYSIQLTVVLSAVVAVAFSGTGLQKTLLAAPLASIYFTVLVLYSYRVHRLLARYLREEIEPKLAEAANTDVGVEWERYYVDHAIPGIRKRFFLLALWVVTVASLGVLWFAYRDDQAFRAVLIAATILYVAGCVLISWHFGES